MAGIAPQIMAAAVGSSLLSHQHAKSLARRGYQQLKDTSAEELALGKMGYKGFKGVKEMKENPAFGRETDFRYTQPGTSVDSEKAIGHQRERYDLNPDSLSDSVLAHGQGKLLDRRFASGDFNMINRRRRAQPRDGEGLRLSFRNTQPNQGTFGIGQGINR